jgi:hypothetical protein
MTGHADPPRPNPPPEPGKVALKCLVATATAAPGTAPKWSCTRAEADVAGAAWDTPRVDAPAGRDIGSDGPRSLTPSANSTTAAANQNR